MSSKKQFIDPIMGTFRLAILYFLETGTKIRIIDHTVQLVLPNVGESLIWRPLNGDSREDLYVLFSMIVRFNEFFLIEKKNNSNASSKSTNTSLFDHMSITESEDKKSTGDFEEEHYSNECYECLKKMAGYVIKGLTQLEKTYGSCNAALVCRYLSNLLQAGINETYTRDMLPEEQRDLTGNTLLDEKKIKKLWKDSDIVTLTDFFDRCFKSHESGDAKAVSGYLAAITSLLNKADEEFKKVISLTNSA